MLTLLIPGPKSPGKDIDVYLRPLIDDLKDLWAKTGVETIDVATGLKFNMRAMVLWTINDFPARSSWSGWSGQGYMTCPTCNEYTPSVRVLGKTAYVGHKRLLKKPHKWRRSLEFNGETENRDPPREFNGKKQGHMPTRIPMESSATREYPSLIHIFFLTHTVNGVFLNPEDKDLFEEILRLQGLGSNTETGVPYTEDEIMAIIRGGKQRGHILGVGRVLPGQGMVIPPPPPCTHSSDVVKLKKREKVLTRHVNMFMKLFRSDEKFSQMLTQHESQPEIGGGSGSGGRGDDEQEDDEDDGEDGEDEDDS
ncbi:subtilisin-like protease SBT4.3 [Tanacetum coccineum]